MRVTILGAGNGGQTMAADLAARGADVLLYEYPALADTVAALRRSGNVIRLSGALQAEARLHTVTTDIEEAMAFADVVYFVAPAFAQAPMLEPAVPLFRPGQIAILVPGNFGSLWLRRRLIEAGTSRGVFLGETDTLPYACRLRSPGHVDVWDVKTYTGIGTLPGDECSEVCLRLEQVFPVPFRMYGDVLNVGIANTNMIIHCVTMLMNAGRIENDERGFRFYADGMTESVCAVMEAMDRERLAVGEALGCTLTTMYQDAVGTYADDCGGESLHEALTTCAAYSRHGVDSPRSLAHRYLTEDVPYLLVPLAELAALAGIPVPVVTSVITLAETVHRTSYRSSGRTLESLGLAGMSREEIIACVRPQAAAGLARLATQGTLLS